MNDQTHTFRMIDSRGAFTEGAIECPKDKVQEAIHEHLNQFYPDWECVVTSGPGMAICSHRDCTLNYRLAWWAITPSDFPPRDKPVELWAPNAPEIERVKGAKWDPECEAWAVQGVELDLVRDKWLPGVYTYWRHCRNPE